MHLSLRHLHPFTDVFLKIRQSLIWSMVGIARDALIVKDLAQDTFIRACKAVLVPLQEHFDGICRP